MRKFSSLTALALGILFSAHPAFAQFPKVKIPKPKSDSAPVQSTQQTTDDTRAAERSDTASPTKTASQPAGTAGRIYVDLHSNSTPLLVKDSVNIQARTHNSYWKLPNQSNYSSWVPTLRFSLFYDNSTEMNLVAEYSNSDGSPWFVDELEHDLYKPEPEHGEVQYRSKDSFKMLETKSTVVTGTYGIKITNRDTGAAVFQGKFKVNRFRWDDDQRDKNKFDFFVEHDWLLPIGYVGFSQNIGFDFGAQPIEVSVWLKGNIERSEVEARLFYDGKQIATTANPDGLAVSDEKEIVTEHSVYSADVHNWKLWHFQWMKTFIYDNGGEFNHDNFPNAFYADKNPGEYTVKIYRKGSQVRELKFTIGTDGKFVDAGYGKPLFLAQYKVIVPVKVIGGSEKWDVLSWKTDAFYGNPIAGFSVP